MADNVTFTLNADSTPPNGTVAATDELADGSHAGITKLAYSADGVRTFVQADADGLLVNLGANNDVTVTGTVSVTEPVSVDDNGGSLTVDAPLATPVHTRISDGTDAVNVSAAGALQVDGSGVTQPVSAAALPLPAGAATSALQLPDGHNVTVDNGAGAAAVNIQDGGNVITVDGTVSVTEPVSVDDNGGSLTVDAPLATPVHTRLSDGTDVTNVTAAGELNVLATAQPGVDIGDVTINNAAGASAVNVQDGGNSLTIDNSTLAVVGGGTEAAAMRVTVANDSTGVLSVDDNGSSLTVDNSTLAVVGGGTEAAAMRVTIANDSTGVLSVDDNGGALTVDQATAANLNAQVVGTAAHASPTSGNPVYVAGRASTAVPTDVGADGDAAGIWLNRNGAPVVTMAPHVGLFGLPWNLVSETAQYTTTQTSTVLVAGGASERLVVTSLQIQAGGTTAGTLQVYFGTGAYSRGTNFALFDGEFAPSTTLKPGVVMQGPFISATNGDDILVTDSAAINPLTITVWYYVVT